MEDSENSCLSCMEDESSLTEQYHYKDENLGFCSVSDCDSVYIEMLIQKETIFRPNTSNLSVESELQCARVAAVKWILDKRVLFGFHFRTAYLSVIYFDLFLSRSSIDNGKLWAVRLLSVACLSLAIIAAAAVLAACDHHLTEKLVQIKMNKAVPSWGSLEREHAYSCYNLLREIGMSKPEMPGLIISRNLSSSSIDDLDDSIFVKKRRLNYIDGGNQDRDKPITRKSY